MFRSQMHTVASNKHGRLMSLENKCTLVAFSDAIAYQYPRKMMELGVDSPSAFVEIVVQAGLPFEKFKGTSIFSNNILKQLRDAYRSNNSSQGHPFIWPILCYFMDIDVYTCTNEINITVNDMNRATEGVAVYKRLLSNTPQSKNSLYNIKSAGDRHVEFVPFATVFANAEGAFYAKYSANRRREMDTLAMQHDFQQQSPAGGLF